MSTVLAALTPVILATLAGVVLNRIRFLSDEGWASIDKLCYFVLFPAIIFKELVVADFSGVAVWGMAFALMAAILTMAVLLLASRKTLESMAGLGPAGFTSLFQGATRWNALIALSIIPLAFGSGALALGAVAVAAMIPLLNILSVIVLNRYARSEPADWRRLAHAVFTNPYVVSTLAGLLCKTMQLPLPGFAVTTLDLVGKGALGLALISVGAGLRFELHASSRVAVSLATSLKLLGMPLLAAFWLSILGVSGEAAGVAILCTAVPTAASAYVLASRMGGDAPLMAQILTFQTICAAVTLPVVLGFTGL